MTPRNTRRSPSRAKPRAARPALTARNVVLAGLGAVALGRRQARETLEGLAIDATAYQSFAADTAHAAGQRVAKLAGKAKTALAPIRRQAEAFARDAEREFEAAVVPVLAKLGLAEAKKRRAPVRAHKAAVRRKPAGRKAARKA